MTSHPKSRWRGIGETLEVVGIILWAVLIAIAASNSTPVYWSLAIYVPYCSLSS
jgi:hypothetical protein